MDVGQTPLVGQAPGFQPRVAIVIAVQDDLGPQPAASGDLDQRGKLGHDHRHADRQQAAVIGQAQRMIAGRCGHHAAAALVGREQGQRIARTTLLEAAGALQVFQLAKHPRAGDLSQRDRLGTGGCADAAGNPAASRFDVVERERHGGRREEGERQKDEGRRQNGKRQRGRGMMRPCRGGGKARHASFCLLPSSFCLFSNATSGCGSGPGCWTG